MIRGAINIKPLGRHMGAEEDIRLDNNALGGYIVLVSTFKNNLTRVQHSFASKWYTIE